MSNIDFEGMGNYFNKSARALRRWEQDKPQKFSLMLDEYLDQLNPKKETNAAEIIVFASLKGGVGKSTVSDALGYYLGEGEAVILNVDISQPSLDINACKTIDYVNLMDRYTINEIIDDLQKKYRYVIIDTPGEVTPVVMEALKRSSKVVIPMTIGKRTRMKTQRTLETFFSEGTTLSGDYKIYFFFNAYINKKKRDASAEKFLAMFKAFKPANNIKLKAKLGSLDHSDAISTAEEDGKSILKLAEENRNAYKSILGKINSISKQIESHLEL